jgi:hypothetical protein
LKQNAASFVVALFFLSENWDTRIRAYTTQNICFIFFRPKLSKMKVFWVVFYPPTAKLVDMTQQVEENHVDEKFRTVTTPSYQGDQIRL